MTEDRSDQPVRTATVHAMASEPMPDAGVPQSAHNEQLSKEAEVGITEFVSPDLPGFVGILKKRSVKTPHPALLLALTHHIASQIHRLSGQ